jgi:hypothetical protein
MYEEDVQINRNPFTGAMSIVKEDEFIPMGGGGNMRNMGNIQQEFEQERIGFGPQGYVVIVVLSDEPTSISLQVRNV